MPTEVPVVGDAREGLQALLPLLKQRSDTSFLEKYQKQMGTWREKMAALQDGKRDPIAPEFLVSVLDELAADDAILTCDSGTIATWAARHWHIRAGRQFYLSGNLATMAPGLPYAIGIQQAYPGRQVIGYVGDGGFSMLMAEFITAIQHHLPVKIVINNNTRWARSAGSRWCSANDGPALVDVNVNPDEPPLPGKVEYQQAKKFAQAFLRGQPRKSTIAATLFRDKIDQLRG